MDWIEACIKHTCDYNRLKYVSFSIKSQLLGINVCVKVKICKCLVSSNIQIWVIFIHAVVGCGSQTQLQVGENLKVIYHSLYGINNYVLIWGDWLSCDPLRGSHDSRSPHIWGWLAIMRPSHDSQSPHIRKHLYPILWQLWFICHKIIHTI